LRRVADTHPFFLLLLQIYIKYEILEISNR